MKGELASTAYSKGKRKLRDEQLEMPFPKQVCRDHHLDRVKLAKEGGESEPESINSNSFHSNNSADSFMSCDDEDKTDGGFQETHTSEEASTWSASWAGTSSDVTLFSSENSLFIHSSSSEQESLSANEHQDCSDCQNRRHVVEFGSNEHTEIGCYTDKDLENLLYSNGVAPGYILSSGRWSVDQGAEAKQEGKKKLTIDKEFEQYFSMLML